MQDLTDFYNDGFGWICRRCEAELAKDAADKSTSSRLFKEGESESKDPQMSTVALAKWLDRMRTTLICPRCGLTEKAERS